MSKYMVIFSALCILLLGMEGKGIVNVAPLTNATGNIFETNIKPSTPNFRSWTPIAAPDTYADRITHATVYDPVEDKIYMIGGSPAGGAGTELALCQQYDPVTNTWSDKASMTTARGYIKGDYVRGKIYVIGGLSNSSTALSTNEEYTISSNTWATKTAIPYARIATIEDVWRDSLIYVMGGWDGVSTSGYTDVEIYNPFTNTWATGSALPMNGDMGSCAIVGDTIYITNAVNRSGSAYWPNIYKGGINPANPTSITWSPGPVPPILSSGTGTAAIGDNIYWIVGTTCFKYNRTTGVISTVDPYPIATCRCNFLVSRPNAYELYGIAGDANGNWSTPNNYYYKNYFPPSGLNDEPNKLLVATLNAPKPNPILNGLAHISFTLAEPSQVSLKIYNTSGRLVKTLVNDFKSSGVDNVNWNCRDDEGREVARGIYFCTLETPKQNYTKKLVLIK
jgi:hypothetical protein